MRYVNLESVRKNLPSGWDQRAREAEDAVAATEPGSRADEVKKHSALWTALKGTLKVVSHQKCWYCESADIRSDDAVDHFRPKGSVAECADHDGYWWLAFKWQNYRFCCTYCNCRRVDQATRRGGGKADRFPLRQEANRAKVPTDSLAEEEPNFRRPGGELLHPP